MTALELHDDLSAILDEAVDICDASFGLLQRFNPLFPGLEIIHQVGFKKSFLDIFHLVKLDESCACSRAFRNNQRVIIPDVTVDPEFSPYRAIAAAVGFRAVQSSPLRDMNGSPIGVLSTHFSKRPYLSPAAIVHLESCAWRAGRVFQALETLDGNGWHLEPPVARPG